MDKPVPAVNEPELRFGVLGPLQVVRNGERVRVPGSGVLRGLLGALLLAQPAALPPARLLDLVWAGDHDGVRKGSVQVGISRLRSWLSALGPVEIVRDSDGYRLTVEPQAIDVSRLAQLVAQAAQTADPVRRHRILDEAVGLSRGPILADVPTIDATDPLVQTKRDAVRATGLAYAQAALAVARPQDAIPLLEAMVAEAPLDEAAHAWLLRLLAASGRPAEALARYETLRVRLGEDLGVSPSADVQRVHLEILDTDEEMPTPRPEPAPPCMLPPDRPDLVGRAEEIHWLLDLLARRAAEPTAMVTAMVVGVGGIGKTTLVTHVAHRLRNVYPDGQLYVDLQAEGRPAEPAEVLARFLTALGVTGRAIPAGLQERAERLRMLLADRRVLIVLDNARDEQQIRPLLPGGPGCAVLVNGRRRFPGLSGRTLRLEEFTPAAALALLDRVAGTERVRAEPGTAAEIVALCGFLPLAVHIAGARLAARENWSLRHLAERLRQERGRLDELAVGDLTVRASLATSYFALDTGAQRAFRLLGLLDVPDFATWACAALLEVSIDEAEAQLDALMDAQLLDCTGTDAGGCFRYRYHDLVRLYARERAEAEDGPAECAGALLRAFGAWLAVAEIADRGLPERVGAEITGSAARSRPDPAVLPTRQADCLAWFDSERAALAACVAQAAATGLAGHAWELAASATGFYAFRGLYTDWSRTHETALQACASAGDDLGAAVMVRNLSYLRVTGVRTGSRRIAAQLVPALRTFQKLEITCGEVEMLGLLAFARRAGGAADDTLALADEAMAKAKLVGYELAQCRLWYLRAVVHREQGRYRDAARCAERCLEGAVLVGTAHDRVLALWELAFACRGQADLVEWVRAQVREGIGICRQRGERLLEAFLMVSLSELSVRSRPTPPASVRAQLDWALSVFEEHATLIGAGIACRLLGEIELAAGRPAESIGHLSRAEHAFQTVRNVHELALTRKVKREADNLLTNARR